MIKPHENNALYLFKLTACLLVFLFILTPFAPVFAADTTTTTIYPSKYYNTDGITSTKHIFANGNETATIKGTGTEAVPRYVHTDQLTGSNVVTNSSGTVDETLDYYPFGNLRIDSGSFNDQRKFAGSEFDSDTGLNYMNARYYDSAMGKFASQDNIFRALGDKQKIKSFGIDQNTLLANPQTLNSYSYGLNNPIIKTDPDGNCPICLGVVASLVVYSPQITSFLQSLTTPLGQVSLVQAGEDAQKGRYGWAVFGALSAGNLPEGRIAPMFDGLWSAGKGEVPVLNAIDHTAKHGLEFGIQSAKDFIKSTRNFITMAINDRLPTKIERGINFDTLRTYDKSSNTFSAFEVNKSTNAITPRTMFKPESGLNYFSNIKNENINIWNYFKK